MFSHPFFLNSGAFDGTSEIFMLVQLVSVEYKHTIGDVTNDFCRLQSTEIQLQGIFQCFDRNSVKKAKSPLSTHFNSPSCLISAVYLSK